MALSWSTRTGRRLIPELIRGLRATDPQVRKKARGHLYGNIFHQGTRYEASAYAVPFLLELLEVSATPERARAAPAWSRLTCSCDTRFRNGLALAARPGLPAGQMPDHFLLARLIIPRIFRTLPRRPHFSGVGRRHLVAASGAVPLTDHSPYPHRMSSQAVSATVAVAAFALGVINLWYSVLRPWWRNRIAQPDAKLELLAYETRQGWDQNERVVVTNHGPGTMKNLVARVFDDEGEDYTDRLVGLWPKLPVPTLHPGQTLHLKLTRALGDGRPGRLLVRWRDGRQDVQEGEFWLSYHRVT